MGSDAPTRLPSGITNVAVGSIFADMVQPVPTLFTSYYQDFFTYVAGDWVVTETDAGATEALTAGSNGLLLITNTAADNDLVALQKTPAMLLMNTSQKCFFSARLKVSDAVESDVVVGMQVVDITPLDVTDGIYFLKADGAATIDIVCRKDATTGSTSATAIASMVNDTFILLEWYYDGVSKLYYAVNGTVLGSITITNYFPDTTLTVSVALQNGEAVAKTMTIDYLYVAQARTSTGA